MNKYKLFGIFENLNEKQVKHMRCIVSTEWALYHYDGRVMSSLRRRFLVEKDGVDWTVANSDVRDAFLEWEKADKTIDA